MKNHVSLIHHDIFGILQRRLGMNGSKKTWTFFQALTFGADRRESGLPEVRTAPDRVESWRIFWVPQTSWLHHWTRPARAKISRRCWEFFCWWFSIYTETEVVFFLLTRGKHVENRKHEFESRIMRCLSFGDWILCFDNITFDELILVHHRFRNWTGPNDETWMPRAIKRRKLLTQFSRLRILVLLIFDSEICLVATKWQHVQATSTKYHA